MYFLDLVASREGNWVVKDRDERLYTIRDIAQCR